MADLSNPCNMAMHDKLLEEYKREHNRALKRLFLSRCHTTEQGIQRIHEWQIPSNIEILMEMRSSGNLSDVVFGIVKDLIDKIDSSNQAHVAQKSVIEKPANNPCKSVPDVAGQDAIRLSQAEIVEPNSPSKYTETNFSTSTFGGQQNKGKDAGCTTTGLTGSSTGLTASPRVSQNKSKPKMVKPKKPEIGVWKLLNPRAVISMKRKNRSQIRTSG